MSTAQKGIKIIAYLLAITIIVGICSGIYNLIMIFTPVNNKIEVKELKKEYKEINKLDISLGASSLTIEKGDKFLVEAYNLPSKLDIEEKGKKLVISMKKSITNINNINNGEIKITIPDNLDKLKIRAGAGTIDISDININDVDIELGAGNTKIDNVKFSNVEINGGLGNLEITDSELKDLLLEAGAGNIHISSKLLGKNTIKCGVGKTSLTLIGSDDDYTIKAKKGLGSLTIDGKDYGDEVNFGEGKNKINIDGGVGSINIRFKRR